MNIPYSKIDISRSSYIEVGFNPQNEHIVYFRKCVNSSKYTGYTKNGMNMDLYDIGEFRSNLQIIRNDSEYVNRLKFEKQFLVTGNIYQAYSFDTEDNYYLILSKSRNSPDNNKQYWTKGLAIPTENLDAFLSILEELCGLDIELIYDLYFASEQYRNLLNKLETSMHLLNQREIKIFKLRYGIDEKKCYSLNEISSEFGLSYSRINQLIKQIELKIQI